MAYNTTYFKNNPDVAKSPGVLYILVLVNKRTQKRECIKIGITKGKSYKAVSTRAGGFGAYEHRVQKIIKGTLEEVYNLEQTLHRDFCADKYEPIEHFGGHTECFNIEILRDVLDVVRS